jgi:dihydrofolate synthase/folylpolyglutamate synthase
MNFKEALGWLNSFQKFGIKLGLERIEHICERLGNPQNNYKIIHVGGTNGKGSVCRFLDSILVNAGYKTGVYTSPHLQRFTERFTIKNREISEKDAISLVEKIKPIVDEMIKNDNTPTYFEIVTGMAFQYFSDKNVDFAIVEVGLGGRYDATNIANPILTVITNVSLEHQDRLGKTIKEIAFEKAGIIKNMVPVITAAKDEALKVIENAALEQNVSVNIINRKKWKRTEQQEFLVNGFLKDYQVKIKMVGKFQGENIALAIATIENLQMQGVYVSEANIIEGIENTMNPGRMEVISCDPIILLDGAHNVESIKMLRNVLENDFDYTRLILVLGILSDKNIKEMLKVIVPLADIVVTTKSHNARACDPTKLKEMILDLGFKKEVLVKNQIKQAIEYVKSVATKHDFICISGSLFTVGEARD